LARRCKTDGSSFPVISDSCCLLKGKYGVPKTKNYKNTTIFMMLVLLSIETIL